MKWPTKEQIERAMEKMDNKSKLPETALGMYPYHDPETKGTRYAVVKIAYNPETGDVGFVEVVTKDIREDAIDKFKVQVDELGFFSGERPKYE